MMHPSENRQGQSGSGTSPRSPGGSGGFPVIEETPLPVADSGPAASDSSSKITAFGEHKPHAEKWDRTPNKTGVGAIHVKTFHSKLTDDALRFMDQCINEWLDAHPEYEVKFATTSVGELTGKLKEPHVICQVWV